MVAFTSFLGAVYLLTARPYYTASALILIDNRRIGAVESSYAPNSASGDAASSLIDSQVEVIKAESMAARVIRQLNLVDDPEFKNAGASEGRISKLKRRAASFFGRSAPEPADTAEAKIHWAADLLRATARKAVRNILMSNSEIYGKCLGVVLNNVNVSQLRLYEGPGSRYHYYNEYAKSYYIGA